ncbi:MAG: hypothetical protein E7315_00915 [Clostridiales bacterium]|nr:hypothetical protein [Clostridiales bacterium]
MAKARKIKQALSDTRKRYIARLVIRCLILIASVFVLIFSPSQFSVLNGAGFFTEFSVFHILWAIWVGDMICQLIPIKKKIPLGSQKLFSAHFKPIREKINHETLRAYIISTTRSAYKVFVIWAIMLFVLGALYYTGVISPVFLFMTSITFYVCDLICVLVWCPFRLIMKNKCCTTCRIFNWDHLMMLTPMIFINGFYSVSLVALSFAVWVVWEVCVMMYPERFWEGSNVALQCSSCTDKLCTQYCRKLRG